VPISRADGMRSMTIGVGFAFATACAQAAVQDGFHAKVAAGCHSEAECSALSEQASARYQACITQNAGFSFCEDELRDKYAAGSLLSQQQAREPMSRRDQ
jgi:hypothetical protein